MRRVFLNLLVGLAWLGSPLLSGVSLADGDAARGRALMVEPQESLCVLCHTGPFPELAFMGTLAPDLSDVGARMSKEEIRARIVDSRSFNPDTIMPPFLSTENLNRVGKAWENSTILTEQDVDDITSYLSSLTGDNP